ncbi:MAG TPA: hypothetical protein VGW38_11850 [Chloroflexota bacterium]|nr:hypothetical protein [Chloroflexota bacterium]
MSAKATGTVWPRGRGGRRPGAGRPGKRDWWTEFEIGQACEVLWREASKEALDARLATLPHADEVRALQVAADAIPISQRKEWLASEGYSDHYNDIEGWLHARASALTGKSAFEEGEELSTEGGTFKSAAPRQVTLSTTPPKGTRQQIIATVAAQYDISQHTANRLWKAYRRFERALCEGE